MISFLLKPPFSHKGKFYFFCFIASTLFLFTLFFFTNFGLKTALAQCTVENCDNLPPPPLGPNYCCAAPNYVCNDQWYYACTSYDETGICDAWKAPSPVYHNPCSAPAGGSFGDCAPHDLCFPPPPPPPPPAACSDGSDNDGDGLVDYGDDPGCSSSDDDDEYNEPPPPGACDAFGGWSGCVSWCQGQGYASCTLDCSSCTSSPPPSEPTPPPPPPPPPPTDNSVRFRIFNDLNSDGLFSGTGSGEEFTTFSSSIATLSVDGFSASVGTNGQTSVYSWVEFSSHSARVFPATGWTVTQWRDQIPNGGCNYQVKSYTSPNYTASHTVDGYSTCGNYFLNLGIKQIPPPSNLSVSGLPACAAGNYSATLSWTNSANNWSVDVDNDGNWSNGYLAFKSIASGTSTSIPAGFNNGLLLFPGGTYYWRIYYGMPGQWVYYTSGAGDSTTGPGDPFSVPGCLDLKARFVKPLPSEPYSAGDSANATVRVSNIGDQASAATTLGLWVAPGDPAAASCPSSPATPPVGKSWSVAALSPGAAVDIPISFNVGSSKGSFTANAYVIPACNQSDSFWGNNSTSGAGQVGEGEDSDASVGGFTFTVNVNAWFETTEGDVGSQGNVNISQRAPDAPAKYNSEYLVAGSSLGSNVKSENNWKISGYSGHRLVPGGSVYNYLADRFRSKASGSEICNIPAGLPPGNNFYQCTGDAQFHVGNGPNGNNVFFIDGNLVVDGNLTLASSDSSIFIVKGNITINSDVTRIDGIYVAGGQFSDATDTSDESGAQLVINGSVFADSVRLNRYLGGSRCPSGDACDNALTAADVINFQTKYLVALNSMIGSPSISWNEVAP